MRRNTSRSQRSKLLSKAAGCLLVIQVVASACGILGPERETVGTVEFIDIEGGCWVINTSKTTFEPINLSDEFRVDGLRVAFEWDRRRDLGSFCMVGIVIELKKIRRLQ